MKKIGKMNELAWVFGMIFCTLGVCLCTKANFGLSMIAATPYILHLKIVEFLPWYTQGTSENIWQIFLLILTCVIIRKVKLKFLFSFAAGFIAGAFIDMWFMLLGGNGAYTDMTVRIAAFCIGEIFTGIAIAFYFRTSMPLQTYELVVVEIAEKFKLDKNKTKLVYDFSMLFIAVLFAVVLNGNFKGIGIGTVIITLVNAKLIEYAGKILDKFFTFEKRFAIGADTQCH